MVKMIISNGLTMRFLHFLRNTDNKTRWFYFQWFMYMLVIVLSTVYVYARLDFVRSGPSKTEYKQ